MTRSYARARPTCGDRDSDLGGGSWTGGGGRGGANGCGLFSIGTDSFLLFKILIIPQQRPRALLAFGEKGNGKAKKICLGTAWLHGTEFGWERGAVHCQEDKDFAASRI